MFGTLGGPELLLIFVIALIVFGPRKLPEIGKSVGKMMAEFRKASNDFKQTIESEVEAEKLRDAVRVDPFAPSASGAPPALSAAGGATGADVPAEPKGDAPATEAQQPAEPAEPTEGAAPVAASEIGPSPEPHTPEPHTIARSETPSA